MKEVFVEQNKDGWTYYIDSAFAYTPTYCNGTLVWFKRYWKTWPEKDGKPIMSEDGKTQMYVALYPKDPRKK